MNMTRRKFFRGVAIGLPAALVASKLPALAADTTIADGLFDPYRKTIYTSLPTQYSLPIATWRKLYKGADPDSFASDWWETEEGKEVMNETNKILAEMKWIEA